MATAILAWIAMAFTCLATFNHPAADRKAKAAGTVCMGMKWPVATGMVSSSLMRSPDGINFSALQNSIKTFQFVELENKLTSVLSGFREKERQMRRTA